MPISLQGASFPNALGKLKHSVQFFKIAAFASMFLSLFLVSLLTFSVSRGPEVIALTPEGDLYRKGVFPKAESEIEEAIRRYIDRRYNWTSRDVEEQLQASQVFVLPSQRRDFREGLKSVIQFASEKSTARRVYVKKVKVDLEKKTASITGDRVAIIQGLWAANELKLTLSFESNARTAENPWGIYVTKEKEE